VPGEKLYLVGAIPDPAGNYPVYDQCGRLTDLTRDQVSILSDQQVRVSTSDGQDATKVPLMTVLKQVQDIVQPAMDDLLKKDPKINDQEILNAHSRLFNAMRSTGDVTLVDSKDLDAVIEAKVGAAIKTANEILAGRTPKMTLMLTEKDVIKKVKDKIPAAPTAPSTPSPAPSDFAATLKVAPGDSTDSGKTQDQTPAVNTAQDTLPFQVVFLPDFEEQYAIRNVNVTAKTKYRYTFRNGTDLVTVSGSYDSTAVPIAIVETVGALITAVGEVAKTRLGAVPGGMAKERSE